MNRISQRSVGSGIATIGMSDNTKGFLQKICYKSPASVDMIRFGFICDSKVRPVNLLLKPLRKKLEKICAPENAKTTIRKKSAGKKLPPQTVVVEHTGASKNRKEATARGRRKCRKNKMKVPSPPHPSHTSIFKKTSTKVLNQSTRKSKVTFEDPRVTEIKNQLKQTFHKW